LAPPGWLTHGELGHADVSEDAGQHRGLMRLPERAQLGERDLLGTRLPIHEADQLRDLADQYGMTNNDFLAELLRIGLRHLDEFPENGSTQKELPLKAS
jgi:hypothetical protein